MHSWFAIRLNSVQVNPNHSALICAIFQSLLYRSQSSLNNYSFSHFCVHLLNIKKFENKEITMIKNPAPKTSCKVLARYMQYECNIHATYMQYAYHMLLIRLQSTSNVFAINSQYACAAIFLQFSCNSFATKSTVSGGIAWEIKLYFVLQRKDF